MGPGFLYCASQGNLGPCGSEGILYLSDGSNFSFKLSLGHGTNNWTEMHANLQSAETSYGKKYKDSLSHGQFQVDQ